MFYLFGDEMKKIFIIIFLISINIFSNENINNETKNIIYWKDINNFIKNSKIILNNENKVKYANENHKNASYLQNPSLNFEAGNKNITTDYDYSLEIELTIPFEFASKRNLNKKIISYDIEIAKNETEILKFDIIQELSDIYFEISYLNQYKIYLTEILNYLIEIKKITEIKISKGVGVNYELNQIIIEEKKIKLKLNEFDLIIEQNKLKLSKWINLNDFDVENIENNVLTTNETAVKVDELPQIKNELLKIKQSENIIKFEQNQNFSNFDFGIFYEKDFDEHLFGINLSIPLPIFNNNEANINKSKYELTFLKNNLEILKKDYELNINNDLKELTNLYNSIKNYKEEIIPLLNSVKNDLQTLYDKGEITFINLIESYKNLNENYFDYLELLKKYHQNYSKYQWSKL